MDSLTYLLVFIFHNIVSELVLDQLNLLGHPHMSTLKISIPKHEGVC